MSTPNIETKELGISLEVGKGTYYKTEFVNERLQLKKTSETTFEKEGYWESEVVDIVGKFKEYDKIALTKTQFTSDLYLVETRTSDDGVVFDDYIALSVGGHILSTKRRFIQIKITLYVGYVEENVLVDDFNTPLSKDKWDSSFVEMSNGSMRLKENYSYEMVKDDTWTQEGTLFRQPIQKTRFKQINTLEIE